jgi:hypothetical protein
MLTYDPYVPLFCSRVGIPCLHPAEIDLSKVGNALGCILDYYLSQYAV